MGFKFDFSEVGKHELNKIDSWAPSRATLASERVQLAGSAFGLTRNTVRRVRQLQNAATALLVRDMQATAKG
jgi:hypothetical protein